MKKIYLFVAICCLASVSAFAQTCSISITSAPGTEAQSVCKNTPLVDITYQVSGTSATVAGLPSGINGSFSVGVFTISGSPAVDGTFNYTVTTTGGCSPDASATGSITVNPIPTTTVNNATICAGTSVTLTAGGATTYAWSGGFPAGATLTDAPTVTTSYTVTGTTAGCSSSGVGTVTVIPLDDASFSYTPATVCITGGSDPVPTITGVTGGTFSCADAGLTINSSTGVISLATTPLGTYTVTYSVSGQCLSSSDFVMSIVNAPATDFTFGAYCKNTSNPFPTFINGGSAGVFTVTPAGLSFVSTNTGEVDLTASSPGTYNVTNTIAAAGGCPATTYTNTITINPIPNTTVSSATACSGTSATITAGGGATTFAWSGGFPAGATLTDSPPATTSYTVTGTTAGCSSTAVGTITVVSGLTIAVNSPVVCIGNSATLTASGATTYSWSDGSTANPLIVSPASTTPYTVTGTSAGCSDQAVATVTVNSLPTISTTAFPSSAAVCSGGSVTLSGSGAITYVWSGGIVNGNNFVPTTTTTYTLTGTDANNCSNTATRVVTVMQLPVIRVNSPTICAGETAILTASGANTYSWSNGLAVASLAVTPTATTNYSVSGTNSNGCLNQAITTVTVKTTACTPVNDPLTISVSSTDASNSTICNGTAYATVTGGMPPYSINLGNNTVVDSVYAINNLCEGFYTVNATDAQSNSTSFTFVVGSPATTFSNINPTFVDSVVVDTLVTNGILNCVINYDIIDSITITNFSFVGFDSINVIWSIYQGGTSNTQNAFYQFSMPGVYTFILDLFCTNRATGSVKGIDQIYINKSSTSIETYSSSNISVYPNPSNGSLTIKSLNEGTYSIINELGQTIQQFKLNNSNQFTANIENLNNGIYFIVGDSIQQKIVVIK